MNRDKPANYQTNNIIEKANNKFADQQFKEEAARLKDLENKIRLIPVGWGNSGKGPMLKNWQNHKGYTIEQILDIPKIEAVGAITGIGDVSLLVFDFDGESAFDYALSQNINPWVGKHKAGIGSWQIHRSTDPWRIKIILRPSPKQIQQLHGLTNITHQQMTREKEEGRKGEALEIFFHAGRQAIILGNHVETKGHYYWPYGHGPESLIEPPEEWWNYVLAKQQENIRGSSTKRSARRNQASRSNKRLLDPCPICGRHSGQGGSGLWCEQTDTGLILCMPGTTFNADPGRVLKLGEKKWIRTSKTNKKGGSRLSDICSSWKEKKSKAKQKYV